MKKLQNKLEEKLWVRIKVPATIDYLIGKLTKAELTSTRQYLKLKGVSTLKKEELVKIICGELISRSQEIFAEFDEEVYHLLKHTVGQGGWIDFQSLNIEQILYLRDRGVLFPGIVDGKKVLVMANEFVESFQKEDGPELYGIIQENTYWTCLIKGLLYYFGVLSADQLTEELLKRETIETKDIPRFAKILEFVQKYYGAYQAFDGGLAHLAVSNPNALQKELEKKNEQSFYPFTTEQLVRAGVTGYKDKNEAFLRFSKFLTSSFSIPGESAEEITETCVLYIREGGSLQALMDYIGQRVQLEFTQLKSLMEELVYLSNHSRQWVVKGYTPSELLPRDLKKLSKIKIGRNDPCYCGSGKKYKKCCLRKDSTLPKGV